MWRSRRRANIGYRQRGCDVLARKEKYMTEQELLSVLNLPEEKQEEVLWKLHSFDYYCCLADLAFRLRDEACKDDWVQFYIGQRKVWAKWCETTWKQRRANGERKKHIRPNVFWRTHAHPIHWIMAALAALILPKQ